MRLRVAVLALGTFAIGTDGFVVAGILPGIARDLHTTVATAGLLVTAFAIAYAIAAPLLTAAAARLERRNALVAGMAVLAAANLAAAAAPGYHALMAARVAAALGAALYSPIAMATAVRLSPPAERGRALSLVLAGMTVSLVAGVPAGSLLGSLLGWRWTFILVAALAALCGLGVRVLLPRVQATPATPLSARLALLRRPAVVASLGATFAWITGAFTLYTFIAPVLTAATGWTGPAISGLLLAYGAAAFAGNTLGGQAADRWGARRSIVIALSSLVVSLTALAYAAQRGPAAGRPIAIIAVIAWAAAGWSLTPAQAHRLIALTPAAGPEVLSLNTSAVYLGIAAGAALGGRVLSHLGVPQLGLAGAALELLALVIVTGARARDHAAGGPAAAARRPSPPAPEGARSEPARATARPGRRATSRSPASDHR
ncbi:MAG: MFS transporter [Streptosporangiaceae bacterium]